MGFRIDGEPVPRLSASAQKCILPVGPAIDLPRGIECPQIDFFEVLRRRRSATGGALPIEFLSSLLWHSTLLRERRAGRFGVAWESRSAPSAGGLHPIRLIALPLDNSAPQGVYDDRRHALTPVDEAALIKNRANVGEILGTTAGTTIQFAADVALVDTCYENAGSLIWRDAGALAATMCLVAAALGFAATPVGRTGDAIVRAAGMPVAFAGAGAVHVGMLHQEGSQRR
jgi:hypothetical protein